MAVRFSAFGEQLSRITVLPTITAFTAMGWVYPLAARSLGSLIGVGNVPSAYYGLRLNAAGTDLALFNGTTTTPGSALPLSEWHHVAMTVSGTGAGQHLGYLDGVLDITASGAAISANAIILGNDNASNWFDGRLTAVKLWSRVLSAEQIRIEMRAYEPRDPANLNTWAPLLLHTDLRNYATATSSDWSPSGTLTTEPGPPLPWHGEAPWLSALEEAAVLAARSLARRRPPWRLQVRRR